MTLSYDTPAPCLPCCNNQPHDDCVCVVRCDSARCLGVNLWESEENDA